MSKNEELITDLRAGDRYASHATRRKMARAADAIEAIRTELALMEHDRDGLAVVLSRAKRVLHRAESQKTWREDGWEVPSIDVQTALDILSADPQAVLSAYTTRIREEALREAKPDWLNTLVNDGTYEFTTTGDCDGSNEKHWRRTPRKVIEAGPWEPLPGGDSNAQ